MMISNFLIVQSVSSSIVWSRISMVIAIISVSSNKTTRGGDDENDEKWHQEWLVS